jgi:hypothetical protein
MTEIEELSVDDQLRRERDWAREERDLLAAELASTGVGEYIVANQKLAREVQVLQDRIAKAAQILRDCAHDSDGMCGYVQKALPALDGEQQ